MFISFFFEANYLPFYLYFIADLLKRLVKSKNTTMLDEKPYGYNVLVHSGKLFSLFLFFIEKYILNHKFKLEEEKEGKKNFSESLSKTFEFHHLKKKQKIHFLFFIIVTIILTYLSNLKEGSKEFKDFYNYGYCFKGILILLICLFEKIILKFKFYKQQNISIDLFFFFTIYAIIKYIILVPEEYQKTLTVTHLFWYVLLHDIPLSLKYCIEYYIYQTYFISPYLILAFQGIISLIITIISAIINYYFFSEQDKYFLWNFNQLKFDDYLFGFFFIITSCFENISLLICVTKIRPNIGGLINIIELFIKLIYESIEQKKDKYKEHWITALISYFVVTIGILIYTEIIVLHFCGLDVETRLGIEKRGEEETSLNRTTQLSISINESIF